MPLDHLRTRVVPAPAAPVTDPDRIAISPEQHAWLRDNAPGNDFLTSLHNQFRQKGYLSPKQVACIDRGMAPRPTPAPAQAVDVARIEEIFGYAKSRGIKQPQMRLGDFRLKTASAFSSNAGAIYVTIGEAYLGKIMDGKWMPTLAGAPHSTALADVLKDPTLAAVAYGERTGNCAICGRLLTAEESIVRTIGPICAANYGLL